MTTPNTNAIPVLGLSKFTHNARLSRETRNYAAVVLVDGVAAFEVLNDGHGGGDEVQPVLPRGAKITDAGVWAEARARMRDARKRIADAAASMPAYADSVQFGEGVLCECVIGDLVTHYLAKRDLTRYAKKWDEVIYGCSTMERIIQGEKVTRRALSWVKLVRRKSAMSADQFEHAAKSIEAHNKGFVCFRGSFADHEDEILMLVLEAPLNPAFLGKA